MSNFIFIDESGDPGKPFKKIDNKEKDLRNVINKKYLYKIY